MILQCHSTASFWMWLIYVFFFFYFDHDKYMYIKKHLKNPMHLQCDTVGNKNILTIKPWHEKINNVVFNRSNAN